MVSGFKKPMLVSSMLIYERHYVMGCSSSAKCKRCPVLDWDDTKDDASINLSKPLTSQNR